MRKTKIHEETKGFIEASNGCYVMSKLLSKLLIYGRPMQPKPYIVKSVFDRTVLLPQPKGRKLK